MANSPVDSPVDTAPVPEPPVAPPVLLLVDDEPSVLSALRRLFRPLGYRIEQATSGADALVLLGQQPVDLVISDMRMPGMDGASFLAQARQLQPSAVRLLLTGYADIGATIAAINEGAVHRYITKPWDDQVLMGLVAEALQRRALEQENARLQALVQVQNVELQTLNHDLEARVAERTAALASSLEALAQAHAEVEAHFMLAVTVFSGLLELRQDGIAGHARRVGELARRVAARLGMDERAQRDVQLAGLLHDIGKIGFPDEMLGKPVSKFSADEMARYQRHPLDGEAALVALEQLHGVAALVAQHHERCDGRGFPDGLQGAAILPGARILAAASDYDGLMNGGLAERLYTSDSAKRTLQEGIGSHYDAAVVAALLAVLAETEAEAQADTEVDVECLQPRMVLSQDLVTAKGVILLPAGHVLQRPLIAKLQVLAAQQGMRLTMRVLRRSITPPAGPPGAGPAPRHA